MLWVQDPSGVCNLPTKLEQHMMHLSLRICSKKTFVCCEFKKYLTFNYFKFSY